MEEIKEFIESEEKIIETILSSITIPENTNKKNRSEFILRYGGKELTVFFFPRINTFKTYVENTDETNKIPGETTLLYKAVQHLMLGISKQTNKQLSYAFETKYPNLGEWAKTNGNDIFHWDSTEEKKENNEYSLTCRASITYEK